MKYENRFIELDGVNRPIGATRVDLDNLQNACAAEAPKGLRCCMLFSSLGKIQGVPEKLPHSNGKL